ncbi:hypothetical protein [Mesorhizobium salmacidum]|uniref:Uncharacterized protein n=1 Tax=Mesorhizobium salmacidum TaxID=3015171 RepID=A0ABU8L719_9HYPH
MKATVLKNDGPRSGNRRNVSSGVQPSEDAVTERPLTDPRAEALARAIIATVDKLTYDG